MTVDAEKPKFTMPDPSAITLWHNPRCSKSRGTLALLRDHGIEPVIVDYQKNPPSAAELTRVLAMLGMAPRELLRADETAYAELRLDNPSLTRPQLIDAMVSHPILIQRPIVFAHGKAAVGRPPEAVLAIL